jgi:6-phosphogluconate dehydrogenase
MMKLAMIGLGKMGANMSRRLMKGGHQVVGFDHNPESSRQLSAEIGLLPASSLKEVVQQLEPQRIVWLMVPAGHPTEETILDLADLLSPGDIVIDGGNSNFKDSIRNGETLTAKSINFLDVGTSGGVWGLEEGYSMMVGGKREVVEAIRPVFETLAPAPDKGWGWVGPQGSGHYVKMVHNGIEYGMMESYAEGFELLKARPDFSLNLYQVAEIWRFGSVVRSWLLDLIALALEKDPQLSDIKAWVEDSGEGRWTVMDAIDHSVPAPVIALSLFRRFSSRQEDSYAEKLLAAMRNEFGGHAVKHE